jgi:hypothetical protein
MKALHDRTRKLHDQSAATDLAARVAAIFEQYPALCGFSVQTCSALAADRAVVPLQGGLCLADVTVSTPLGSSLAQELCHRIAHTLLELMDEQPEVFECLPGRTFARALH